MQLSALNKYKPILKIVAACAILYLGFRFLLPLFWPFLIAYACAVFIYPCVKWLNNHTNFPRVLCTLIPIIIFLVLFFVLFGFLIRQCYMELRYLLRNWTYYQTEFEQKVVTVCSRIEHTFSLQDGYVHRFVSDGVNDFFRQTSDKFVPAIMNFSIPTVLSLIEILASVFIFVLATFFFTKDLELFRKKKNSNAFSKELNLLTYKIRIITTAYLKAQLIIMLVTTIICFIGLSLCHNSYALLCSVIIGVLDALPMIGAGIILIPWGIIMLLMGNYYYGVMLFIIFLVCYLARECIEPKILGNKIGIHPIESLVSLYVGYQLFGLVGFILGPIGYILIKEML